MRRRKRKKQRKIIIITSLSLLFILTCGYAAFQTNITITAKGNILKKEMTTTELKKQYCNTTSGDGLYIDTYEEGRCIYKGTNPNNYITFNAETWRILSVENDGTLKIMRKDSIGNIAWDTTGGTYGSNQWSRPADLNTYLNNDYYNTLNSESQNLIQTHTWAVGAVISDNTDLAAQIASENGTAWSGNIGLISISEYLRANTNTQQCGSLNLNNTNYSTCKTTNYTVLTSGDLWAISPHATYSNYVFNVRSNGRVNLSITNNPSHGVVPVLYLTSNITLEGEGTEVNPYTIK